MSGSCPNCGCSSRVPIIEPFRDAPSALRLKIVRELTANRTKPLVDIVVSPYASLAVVFWNAKSERWTKEMCVNQVSTDGGRAVMSLIKAAYAYVHAKTPFEAEKYGYTLDGVVFFDEELFSRIDGLGEAIVRCFEMDLALRLRKTSASHCFNMAHRNWDFKQNLRNFYTGCNFDIYTAEFTITSNGLANIRTGLPRQDIDSH